jgi:hypothetical protein
MAEDLVRGLEYSSVESTNIEGVMQKQAQQKLNDEAHLAAQQQAGATAQQQAGATAQQQTGAAAQQAAKTAPPKSAIGFFGTLGLGWIASTNHAIGGEPISYEGNPEIMAVKDMDGIIIQQVIDSGAELDIKYLKDKSSSPELRYGMGIAMFYFMKGRLGKVKSWLDAHKKEKPEDSKQHK